MMQEPNCSVVESGPGGKAGRPSGGGGGQELGAGGAEAEGRTVPVESVVARRAARAEARCRAAMWVALERKRGTGWSEEEETASRPVMPVGWSSTRLSLGMLRLGVEGLEGPVEPSRVERRRGERPWAAEAVGRAPGVGRKVDRMWWRL